MNSSRISRLTLVAMLAMTTATLLGGCASNGPPSDAKSTDAKSSAASTAPSPNRFLATDGRTIEIGKSAQADGGTRYQNPHLEKGKCWVASGFDFNGYDTLHLPPTLSTAKFPDQPEDRKVHNLAQENLVLEISRALKDRGIFANVVTRESDIQPGAKVLRLENTITEFSKGGGAARYFVGLYGGGQPVLRVQGKATDGANTMFTYEVKRSGTSADARLGGVFMKDEDIQIEDIRSMVLDLTDFMSALAGKYQPKS